MWKKVLGAVTALVIVIGALGGVKAAQIGAMIEAGENAQPPPTSVATAVVRKERWEQTLQAVGTVVAARSVLVAAEVPGLVKRIAFEDGARVGARDLLVVLDTSVEKAQLASARASLELARVSLERARSLAKENINTPAELDMAQAQFRQARAQVENIEAALAKKIIRAPFAGELGIKQVELGQILSAGSPVVRLLDTERVYVDFYLPQTDLGRVREGQAVRVVTDALPGRTWTGKVETIEPAVEVSTRSVRVRARFENPDGHLRPGLFAAVRVILPESSPMLIVPSTSVEYAPYGNSIFVLKDAPDAARNGSGPDGQVVEQIFVKLGPTQGDFVAVEGELEEGSTIVSAGGFKLSNGTRVVVNDERPLEPQLAPDPDDS